MQSLHIKIINEIEVAFFNSRSGDAAGAEEQEGKGKMPKEKVPDHFILGHTVKNCMTVISK